MLVVYRGNKTKKASREVLETIGILTEEYSLKIGNKYLVYSISLWENGTIMYLLVDEKKFPFWYPSETFEIIGKMLPLEWYCDVKIGNNMEAIWGYKEIVFDSSHFDSLIKHDKDAIYIFFNRKREIEQYSELNIG